MTPQVFQAFKQFFDLCLRWKSHEYLPSILVILSHFQSIIIFVFCTEAIKLYGKCKVQKKGPLREMAAGLVREGQLPPPTWSLANLATSIFSPVLAETSVMSCSTDLSGSFT